MAIERNNVYDLESLRQAVDRERETLSKGTPTGGGDGGGASGSGMEARVAKLEAHLEHVMGDVSSLKADVRDVRDRLPKIETKLDHLPGKGFIATVTLVTLAIVAALIAFQNSIQAWVAAAGHH
jgi:hypothetical protein